LKSILFLSWASFASIAASAHFSDTAHSKDIEQRIYALPYYSYGKGLGFTSPDSIYQMNIRFRIQSRGTFLQEDGEGGVIDGGVRRTRLRFDGYVGNPRFTYALQLSFAPGDLGGAVADGENLQVIRDAVVFYSINKKLSVGFGQTKLPGNRQRVNSSGALQLTDRSINNAAFNLDRDFGLQVNYLNQNRDKFSYNFKSAISQGEGRNFTKNDDMHLAYTGKVEIYPFGSFRKNGEYFEGDLMREQKPKLMLSAAYQFNNKAKKNAGQLGTYLYEKKDISTLLADMIFKYDGFAFMAAYMNRSAGSNPIAINPDDPTKLNYVIAGQGVDVQSSYLTTKGYEFIGRYSWQQLDKAINIYEPNKQQYTLGLTKYIWEHAFKIQGELTYNIEEKLNAATKNSWYARFQIEIGI
jgi:phosphate-selective porin OprO/OprP